MKSIERKGMMNAAFRECEFYKMRDYLSDRKECPIENHMRDRDCCCRYECRCQYNSNPDLIIVYLEDYYESGKAYSLLLDFFTATDYMRFTSSIEVARNYPEKKALTLQFKRA